MSGTNFSTIQLHQSHYEVGSDLPGIDFLDFTIDGQSLFNTYFSGIDVISCLFWSLDHQKQETDRLLLRTSADFPNNRRSLYICPLDADLGCGAISAVIENGEGAVTWHTFAFENTYEEPDLSTFKAVGPFTFQEQQYDEVMQTASDWARTRSGTV